MFDDVSLDQLRMLLAVVDEGSFSAAGRKLQRVQSAVSHAMAGLERQLGVTVWERSPRQVRLTRDGEVVVAAARRVCAEADGLRVVSASLRSGLEPSVALAVDALFPAPLLATACRDFQRQFPTVRLRLFVDTLASAARLVEDDSCQLGVVGPHAPARGLEREAILDVELRTVVAPDHPLARGLGPTRGRRRGAHRVDAAALRDQVQIVLSERHSESPDQGVLAEHTWRVSDLATKHALIRGGLGWGSLPAHLVDADVRRGQLVVLTARAASVALTMSLIYRAASARGPATAWLIERLRQLCGAGPRRR